MEGNGKKTKKKVKAQELLETNARYSGWLKKFKQGSRKGKVFIFTCLFSTTLIELLGKL